MTEEYRIYEKGIEVSNLGNVKKNGEEIKVCIGEDDRNKTRRNLRLCLLR